MTAASFFDDAPSPAAARSETVQKDATIHTKGPDDSLPDFEPFDKFPPRFELVKPPLLVDGILFRGNKLVLGGPSKAGKTWGLMDMGISVATGKPFWGRQTQARGVLYIDFELQPVFAKDRLWAVLHAKGMKVPPSRFFYWPLRGKCYDANTVMDVLEERLAGIPDLGLIIADPVYKLAAGVDENSAGQVTQLMLTLEKFAERTGAAICYSHHFRKGKAGDWEDHCERMSGSGSWARDPDSILTMTKHPEANCLVVESTMRNLPSIDPFVVELQPPSFIVRDDLEPVFKPTFKFSEDKLLGLLKAGNLTNKEWEAQADKLGCKGRRFEGMVANLRRQRKVFLRHGPDGTRGVPVWSLEGEEEA